MSAPVADDLRRDGADARSRASHRVPRRARLGLVGRALPVVAAGVLVLSAITILVARWGAFARLDLVGVDLDIYRTYGQRFLDTGSMYAASQLVGPYDGQPYVSGPIPADMPSMYPPTTAYLFATFTVIPGALWWAIPIGVTVYVIARLRPARWTWPLLVLPFATPEAASGLIAGNTAMWLLAGVSGGILWGWPALLVLMKPFLAPFALMGARKRGWWVGLALAAALSVPLIAQWLAYPTVVVNAYNLNYSPIGYVPMLLVPVVAWLGRRWR